MSAKLHEQIFLFTEDYRKKHPDFRHWFREKKANDRLNQGSWFQFNPQTSKLYLGLYLLQTKKPKAVKTICLVFTEKNESIKVEFEVDFKDFVEPELVDFHKKVIALIEGERKVNTDQYSKVLADKNGVEVAEKFLDEFRPKIDDLIRKSNLDSDFFIPNPEFAKLYNQVKFYREKLSKESIPSIEIKKNEEVTPEQTLKMDNNK